MPARPLVFVSLLGLSASLHADNNILYECVDASGNKQFTNIPANPKACRVLNVLTPTQPSAPASPAAGRPNTKPQVASPSQFPRVDREIQRQRDNDRLRILENEL